MGTDRDSKALPRAGEEGSKPAQLRAENCGEPCQSHSLAANDDDEGKRSAVTKGCYFPGAPIQFVIYTQELTCQQQPRCLCPSEGSQPQTILTSSCWPPREEGGPVLHSWWPPSPPSFFPHNTWLHKLPRKLDSNSACLGARFPICQR